MTKLQTWMAERGVTEASVAEAIGVSQPQVSKIKRGVSKPSPDTAEKLSLLTGIPAWELIRPEAGQNAPA